MVQAQQQSNTLPSFIPFRGPFARWPRFSDAVLAVLVFLASLFVPSDNDSANQQLVLRELADIPAMVVVLLAIAASSLFWRRTYPLQVMGVTVVTMALATGLGYSFDFFGVPVALYSIGRYESNHRLSQIGGGAIGLIALIQAFDHSETLPDIGFSFIILFLSWYVGRRVRARGEYLQLLKERAEQLEREKALEAAQAVEEERARIARELHDVVAHQVSMMTVQAGAAKTIANSDPERAIEAMGAVEGAGRQALSELRYLLGVLRPNSAATSLAPQPGLSDLPSLIDGFRQAGLNVSSAIDLPEDELSSSLELAVYRLIQEALTNVIKHAGKHVQASVTIQVTEGSSLSVVISNDQSKTGGLSNEQDSTEEISPGYGLLGMRERIALLGGHVDAGPLNEGGFKVSCRLPIHNNFG